MKSTGRANIIRVHLGEHDTYRGRRLHEEIADRCRNAGVMEVTVYRGIEGYGASSLIHRPGLFGRSSDAPIVVTIVDANPTASGLMPMLEEIVDEGMIAVSSAEVIRYFVSDATG